jgi:DNA-binding NtrC family response regulator
MRRILIVDDDPHIRQATRAWFDHHGFRVSVADGGINGLAALDGSAFDLMIVDVFMPNMPGFESIRMFHRRVPTVPPITSSGYAFSATEPDFLRMATRLGAARCLPKPLKPATLLAVIDECLSAPEPRRRYVATLGAVVNALSESAAKPASASNSMEIAFRG